MVRLVEARLRIGRSARSELGQLHVRFADGRYRAFLVMGGFAYARHAGCPTPPHAPPFRLTSRIIPSTVWENGRKAVKLNLSFEGYHGPDLPAGIMEGGKGAIW